MIWQGVMQADQLKPGHGFGCVAYVAAGAGAHDLRICGEAQGPAMRAKASVLRKKPQVSRADRGRPELQQDVSTSPGLKPDLYFEFCHRPEGRCSHRLQGRLPRALGNCLSSGKGEGFPVTTFGTHNPRLAPQERAGRTNPRYVPAGPGSSTRNGPPLRLAGKLALVGIVMW